MTKKTVVMVLAMLLMLSASAYASEGKDRGWFVYGIYEHETMKTGIDGGGTLGARKTLFGVGAEKTFQHRFIRRLSLEVMTGSAEVDEMVETKHWSGIPLVLVYHTIEHFTHQYGGRWQVRLASEFDLGKGWTLIPSGEWSNSWIPETSQSEYAMRLGKRF
jgi:hypothetical protein